MDHPRSSRHVNETTCSIVYKRLVIVLLNMMSPCSNCSCYAHLQVIGSVTSTCINCRWHRYIYAVIELTQRKEIVMSFGTVYRSMRVMNASFFAGEMCKKTLIDIVWHACSSCHVRRRWHTSIAPGRIRNTIFNHSISLFERMRPHLHWMLVDGCTCLISARLNLCISCCWFVCSSKCICAYRLQCPWSGARVLVMHGMCSGISARIWIWPYA